MLRAKCNISSSISSSVTVICTIDSVRFEANVFANTNLLQIYENIWRRERERKAWLLAIPSIHPWKHHRKRTKRKRGKDAFQRMHFTKPQQPDGRYRLGMTFAQTCQKREAWYKRDKRRTSGGDGKEEKDWEKERQTRAARRKSRFKIAVFCSRRRSTFPDKREGTTTKKSTSPPKTVTPASHSLPAGMEDKGERWKVGK